MRRGGANLASYLLFEHGYCNELIALGYEDTMKRRDEVASFLDGSVCPVPGTYVPPAPVSTRLVETDAGKTLA
jgi:NTE family protein